MRDEGGSITNSRAYKQALAEVLGDSRAGRFVASTALIGHREIAAVSARPSRAKGKARRKRRRGHRK